jgi:hypothetical protein
MPKGRKPRHWTEFPEETAEHFLLFAERGYLTFPQLSKANAFLLRNRFNQYKNAIFRALAAGEPVSYTLGKAAKDITVSVQPEVGADTYLVLVRRSIEARVLERGAGGLQPTPPHKLSRFEPLDEDVVTIRRFTEDGVAHISKRDRW